ncbi:MAG: C26 family cysteine hydrolase domain-containing family, partial [Synergistaceae bacterium]|nr:C26 family cysteine hydrolase domain-containing family [Synergistaceae bacterium]
YHAGIFHDARVRIRAVEAEVIEEKGAEAVLSGVQGILVPGGFGSRGIEGKIAAARYAREKKIPYFGLCLGMQMAVVEFARHVCGLPGANSSEIDPGCTSPVIHLMEDQAHICDKGGTMRLGAYPCDLVPGTKAAAAYGEERVCERHRHRYELNNDYLKRLEEKGMTIAGIYREKNLTEIVELPDHPWFMGVQFHPEFRSRPVKPHPLFCGFIGAAVKVSETNARRENG